MAALHGHRPQMFRSAQHLSVMSPTAGRGPFPLNAGSPRRPRHTHTALNATDAPRPKHAMWQ
jgi:hypothetical protein